MMVSACLLLSFLPGVTPPAPLLDATIRNWEFSRGLSFRVTSRCRDGFRPHVTAQSRGLVARLGSKSFSECHTTWVDEGGRPSTLFPEYDGRFLCLAAGTLSVNWAAHDSPDLSYSPDGSRLPSDATGNIDLGSPLDGNFVFCSGESLATVIAAGVPQDSTSPLTTRTKTKFGVITLAFDASTGLLGDMRVEAGGDDVCRGRPLRLMEGPREGTGAVGSVEHLSHIVWTQHGDHWWMSAATWSATMTFSDKLRYPSTSSVRREIAEVPDGDRKRVLADIPIGIEVRLDGNRSGVQYEWDGEAVIPSTFDPVVEGIARQAKAASDELARGRALEGWRLGKVGMPACSLAAAASLVVAGRVSARRARREGTGDAC